jgi:glycosyltransferase involved in cell wall biosynthesis
LLFIPREPYPTDRVRINVLFGRELLSRGHTIDLVMQAADERVALGRQDWFGCSVWVGPTDSRDGFVHRIHKHWRGLLHDLRSLRRVQSSQYDGVLVSDKFLLACIALPIAHHRSLKFVFWLTFPIPEIELQSSRERIARYPWVARIRGLISGWVLYKWILPRSDYVFVQSERMKDNICAHGIDAAKMSPIVTGFDMASISAVRREAKSGQRSSVVVAYLGTLSAERHLEMLVEVLALLRNTGTNARLLFVGNADRARDQLMLEHRAERLGISQHFEITGFLPQRQALERVASADVCLSPIFRSPILDVGSPTKLIEYLALGIPVVANDHPEQRQILHESRAGVCVPWGARHFARAVRWLMERSAEERSAMGVRGRAWVEANRTYARIADGVERTFLTVLATTNGRSKVRCQ